MFRTKKNSAGNVVGNFIFRLNLKYKRSEPEIKSHLKFLNDMKLLIFLVVVGSVSFASAQGGNRVYNEASAFVNKTRSQWNDETKKIKDQAKAVISGIVKEIETLRSTILSAVKSLKDQAMLDKVNKTISAKIDQLESQFTGDQIEKFFKQVNNKVQGYLSDILNQLSRAKDLPKLPACWDANKANLQAAVEGFMKELLAAIAAETKTMFASAEKFRSKIVETNANVTTEVKKCQSNKDPKGCTTTYVRKFFKLQQSVK